MNSKSLKDENDAKFGRKSIAILTTICLLSLFVDKFTKMILEKDGRRRTEAVTCRVFSGSCSFVLRGPTSYIFLSNIKVIEDGFQRSSKCRPTWLKRSSHIMCESRQLELVRSQRGKYIQNWIKWSAASHFRSRIMRAHRFRLIFVGKNIKRWDFFTSKTNDDDSKNQN